MSSRGRFATPANLPLHDRFPYSHVHACRGRLGFVHRSRTFYLSPRAKPSRYDFATFSSLYKSIAELNVTPEADRLNFSIYQSGVDFKCPYSNRSLKPPLIGLTQSLFSGA
jgi:hypothetical protein